MEKPAPGTTGTVVKGKVVFVGDSNVGKTSIINNYNKIMGQTTPTVGANSITCVVPFEDQDITLNVWDTAGQENFQCLVPMFARCAQVAVIVFDYSKEESFDHLSFWIEHMKENSQVPNILICCNKTDLESTIPPEKIHEFSSSNKLVIYKTSCVSGAGIENLFTAIAEIIDHDEQENEDEKPAIEFANSIDNTKSKSSCC